MLYTAELFALNSTEWPKIQIQQSLDDVNVSGDFLQNLQLIDRRLAGLNGRVHTVFRSLSDPSVKLHIGGSDLSGYERIAPKKIAQAKTHPNFPQFVDDIVEMTNGKIVICTEGDYGVDILPNGKVVPHEEIT